MLTVAVLGSRGEPGAEGRNARSALLPPLLTTIQTTDELCHRLIR